MFTTPRLQTVDRDKLAALGSLVEIRADTAGVLQPVAGSPSIDPDEGVRVAGGRVQFGLTTDEIGGGSRRIASLLERVDNGTIPVF